MQTQEPTIQMVESWKKIWAEYHDRLKPNRKSGGELLEYLMGKYTLTEIYEAEALEAVYMNVTMNECFAIKLPEDTLPQPRAFFLENSGSGAIFYKEENQDPFEIWGGEITKIFIGIDIASGYFMVGGSTMLWDELYAYQGLDEDDIKSTYRVAEYINCLKRFGLLDSVMG